MVRNGTIALVLVLLASVARADENDGLPLPTVSRPPATVTTRFSVTRDGFPFVNYGDFGGPRGNCLGMTLVAIDNYVRRIERRERQKPDAEPVTLQTVSLAQERATKIVFETAVAGDTTPAELRPFSDPSLINAALERIRTTGRPEVMVMFLATGGHANVLYGYRDGKLLLYDPNYPGQTIEWPFDRTRGLSEHPLADRDPWFYGALTHAGAAPPSNFSPAEEVARNRAACGTGASECVDRYPDVEARLEPAGERIAVVGRVFGGRETNLAGHPSPTPDTVTITVNGESVGDARLETDGTFRLELPASRFEETNSVRVVAYSGRKFSGFVDASLARPVAERGLVDLIGTGR